MLRAKLNLNNNAVIFLFFFRTLSVFKTKTIDMERTYKTIKWVLNSHIKNNVRSLWTWENDNFTCIFENYDGDSRIYTPHQLLKLLNNDTE